MALSYRHGTQPEASGPDSPDTAPAAHNGCQPAPPDAETSHNSERQAALPLARAARLLRKLTRLIWIHAVRRPPLGPSVPPTAATDACLTPIPSPDATFSEHVPLACFVSETGRICFVPAAVVMKSSVGFRARGGATNYSGAVLR